MRHPEPERLSAFLDGDCDQAEARELEGHLEGCAACRTVLGQLTELRTRARELPDRLPPRDLWPDIAGTLRQVPIGEPEVIPLPTPVPELGELPRRTSQVSLPRAVAAGLILALLSGTGGAYLGWTMRPAIPGGAAAPDPWVQLMDQADPDLQVAAREVQRLEELLSRYRSELDPEVRWALEKNLGIIDRAIEESVLALKENPGNRFLLAHLQETVQAKEDYLREATRVVAPVT